MLSPSLDRAVVLIKSIYRDFQEFLAPSACLVCRGDVIDRIQLLCSDCQNNLQTSNSGYGPVCPFCRRPDKAAGSCDKCLLNDTLRLFSWGLYDGSLKDLILEFKFKGAYEIGPFLTRLAALSLDERISLRRYDLVIPVPLHSLREKERDFNQSDIIAAELAGILNLETNNRILKRIRATGQQSTLPPKERWPNVKNAFAVDEDFHCQLHGKVVLLVDDIVTTGATIFEASDALLKAGAARVDAFSLAWAI